MLLVLVITAAYTNGVGASLPLHVDDPSTSGGVGGRRAASDGGRRSDGILLAEGGGIDFTNLEFF